MNIPLLPAPQPEQSVHIVQDECQDLMTLLPTPTAAAMSGLFAHGRSLPPLRVSTWQSCRLHGTSSEHCRRGERA